MEDGMPNIGGFVFGPCVDVIRVDNAWSNTMLKAVITTFTTAINLAWLDLTTTVSTGDFTGFRMILQSNRGTSGGPSVRPFFGEAKCKASKYAALLEGGFFNASVAAGTCTVTNMYGVTGKISIGTTLVSSGTVAAVNALVQTRANEDIGVHTGVRIKNEAIGGTGLCLAEGAIYITEATLSGGVKGYECLIDATTATLTDQGGNVVHLIKFVDSAGTAQVITYDVDGNALAVANQ